MTPICALDRCNQPAAIAAATIRQRGERYAERMAGVSEGVLPHLESLAPNEIIRSLLLYPAKLGALISEWEKYCERRPR